jgi:DNA-binding NarL/FixJ family response regulator
LHNSHKFFFPKIIAARSIRKVTFDKSLFKPLTAKETSILQNLADGFGTREIAEMHGTSEQTIKMSFTEVAKKPDATIGCIS